MFAFYCRLVLQRLKLSDRNLAIIGLIMSIVGCFLLADWQSIPHDNCVNLSPFHHPNLTFNTTATTHDYLTQDYLVPTYKMPEDKHLDSHQLLFHTNFTKTLNCTSSYGTSDNKVDCFVVQNLSKIRYSCTLMSNKILYSCVKKLFVNDDELVKIQNLHLLNNDIYYKMMTLCEQAIVEGQHCHWIPKSIVTNRFCHDCQPICRSPKHSLNFVQFCIGAAILMLSIPVAWIPIASLVSERVNGELQVCVLVGTLKYLNNFPLYFRE